MDDRQNIRFQALALAVKRYVGIGGMTDEAVIASAEKYDKFILGEVDNSVDRNPKETASLADSVKTASQNPKRTTPGANSK